MNKNMKKTMLWTPRISAILFVLFISIFALDVFEADKSLGETLVGLFIHLIPSILLTIAIILAWRWEWVGAVSFAGWAILYFAMARGFEWFVYLIVAGIPLIIGIFFLVDWVYRKQIHTA